MTTTKINTETQYATYTEQVGLHVEGNNVSVNISATDDLLGTFITDIEYNEGDTIITLSSGHDITIFHHEDGRTIIQSD